MTNQKPPLILQEQLTKRFLQRPHTRRPIIYHHTSLNNKKTTTYDVGNPGPVFARAQGKNIAGSKRLMKFLDNYKMFLHINKKFTMGKFK
jgi:hypothetical protein